MSILGRQQCSIAGIVDFLNKLNNQKEATFLIASFNFYKN